LYVAGAEDEKDVVASVLVVVNQGTKVLKLTGAAEEYIGASAFEVVGVADEVAVTTELEVTAAALDVGTSALEATGAEDDDAME
jgi:hypothetical protein